MTASRVSVTLLPEASAGADGERALTRAVGGFTFTGTTAQRWESPGRVFEHPLERSNRVVADGFVLEPVSFSVDSIEANVDAQFVDPRDDRAATQLQALEQLRDRGETVTVLCSWRQPAFSYLVKDISGEKTSENGDSVSVSVTLAPLDVVQLELVASQIDADIDLLGTQVVEVDV
jgi:hypothetical protein